MMPAVCVRRPPNGADNDRRPMITRSGALLARRFRDRGHNLADGDAERSVDTGIALDRCHAHGRLPAVSVLSRAFALDGR